MSARWTQADVDAVTRMVPERLQSKYSKFAPKPSKYGNKKTNGFDSKYESKVAAQLQARQLAGEISDLKYQVRFELVPAQFVNKRCVERSCTYVADFTFIEDGALVVADAKGFRDPVYRLKKKLMRALRGIAVREL